MRFVGSDSDIDLATDHPEFSDWKWMVPASLPRFIVRSSGSFYVDILADSHRCLRGIPAETRHRDWISHQAVRVTHRLARPFGFSPTALNTMPIPRSIWCGR